MWAWKESDATTRQQQLQPQFSTDGNSLVLNVAAIASGQADLTIEVPKSMAVTMTADHGNVSVNDLQGAVTVSSNHGNLDLNGINGGIIAHVNDDDSDVSAGKINGGVSIEGRAENINLADITGPVTLQGDFFGTTDVQRVNGAVRFESSRTQFQAERLDGEFEVAGGAELQASGLVGPVVLSTRNHNVTLDRVSGTVVVKNKNGTVDVTEAAPLSALEITNEHGSVDVGLPEGHGFSLDASTRHGEMENDFALTAAGSEEHRTLNGTIAGGGPAVAITTTEGDVTVRKSSVAPLPPAAPPAPVPPATSATPVVPAAPKSLKGKPAPKTPNAPKPPVSVTF